VCRRVWQVTLKGTFKEEQSKIFLKLSSMVRIARRFPFFEINNADVSQLLQNSSRTAMYWHKISISSLFICKVRGFWPLPTTVIW